MDLEFTDLQHELRDTVRAVLEQACPPALVRGIHEGTADGSALWDTAVGLDWPALGLPEPVGGLGLGPVEVGVLVEELGRVVAPGPLLCTLTQFVPLVLATGSSRCLPEVAAGACRATWAVAEEGRWEPAATRAAARPVAGGWALEGTKTHVLDASTVDEIAVVARGERGLGVFVVPRDDLQVEVAATLDPTFPLATVELAGATVGGDRVLVEPGDPAAGSAIDAALDASTAAMALSTVATCRSILEATVAYAKERHQFGRPIGSFQAVKHRLADCYLAVERASALAWFATLTIAEDDPRRPLAVAMAKAAAGDGAQLLSRDGLQLHGGIGFTWEHDLHPLLKRAVTGDLLFGGAAHHRARAAELLGLVDARTGEAVA